MKWFRQLFSRGRGYDDLSVSIREHLEEKIEELMEEGKSREDAERATRREFGNLALVEERSREVWQWPMLDSVLTDLKLLFRRLRKSPGFAVTVLLTMAIGIGANTAVFSVVNSVLLQPLPYPGADQLVSLRLDAPGAAGLADFQNGLPSPPRCTSPSARATAPFNRWERGHPRRPTSPDWLSLSKSMSSLSPTGFSKHSVFPR